MRVDDGYRGDWTFNDSDFYVFPRSSLTAYLCTKIKGYKPVPQRQVGGNTTGASGSNSRDWYVQPQHTWGEHGDTQGFDNHNSDYD